MNSNRRSTLQASIDKDLSLQRESVIASREKEIAKLKALLAQSLQYVVTAAQAGSHDAELLQKEIESI